MLNRCENCGGEVIYDIPSARLKCIHCESLFDPESFSCKTDAEEQNNPLEMNITLYTCPSCGAQISSTENAAIDYCLYCGSFVSLHSEISKVKKPDYIIPFAKTQEECRTAYKSMIRRKLYAPREFRDDSFLEGFKPIYIPFWNYEYTYGPKIRIKGVKSSQHGDYLHKQHYETICHVENAEKNLSFDASSSFDDSISRELVPFDYKKRKTFSPAYMFGFYGDTADVPETLYEEDADKIAREEIWKEVTSHKEVKKGHPVEEPDVGFAKKFNLKKEESLTMLPVWFLTWKKKDRLAYSVINGENGMIHAEIPVSIWRYFFFSLLTAIPIFFLLNAGVTLNASRMLLIAALLAALVILLYSFELESILRRQIHAGDKGYLSIYNGGKEAEMTENLFLALLCFVKENIWTLILMGVGGLLFCAGAIFAAAIIVILLLLAIPAYTLWCIYKQGKELGAHTVSDVAGAYAALVLSVVILIADPPADIIYYIVAIICILAVGYTAICAMRRYNYMITRPMPHFFERKAGDSK